jgi:hypothetical protein
MALTCERLINDRRNGKSLADRTTGQPILDAEGSPRIAGETKNYPYRCDRPAHKLKVSGESFTCFAQLCELHRKAAEREGFRLEILDA